MTLSTVLIITVLGIAIIVILLNLNRMSKKTAMDAMTEGGKKKFSLSNKEVKQTLLDSQLLNNVGRRFGDSNKLQSLFNRSKNPWHLTPTVFTAIRYGGLILFGSLAIASTFIVGLAGLVVFGLLAFCCFYVPNKKYQDAAQAREDEWNQLYQFMWVIKENARYYDPKKVWIETENYIKTHTDNRYLELEQGFKDFSDHWNGSYMDDYIRQTYGEFSIPKELFNVMLTAQQTGEYPEKELDSLRKIIINKMDYFTNKTLSVVGSKATVASSPFLLGSMAVAILFPILLKVIMSF